MAEIRPFRGLRYNPAKVGDLGSAMCPPYDVISPEGQVALARKSPYNVIRVELAQDNDEQAYREAGEALVQWRKEQALVQEGQPALYLARHEFIFQGQKRTRTEITAAVRLEEPEKGIILPHEATRSRAKDDRLQLLRATKTNVSPVMLLHDGPSLAEPTENPFVADMGDGQRFTFWAITGVNKIRVFQEGLATKKLFIADGHHRYETALNYRNELKAGPDDAASYVMAALISFSDPGLIVQGYHRLFRKLDAPTMARLRQRISAVCKEEKRSVGNASPEGVATLVEDAFAGGALFALWGLEPGVLTLLSLSGSAAVDEIAAKSHSRAWAGLPNCIFREALLQPALGIQEEEAETKGLLSFSHDIAEAVWSVNAKEAQLAFLCKAVPFDAFKEVSERGERLPPKSTFFYPKLPTGLVMKPAEGKL